MSIILLTCSFGFSTNLFANPTEKEITRRIIPKNLKKDLPAYEEDQYGCKNVPAAESGEGVGCVLGIDFTGWTYTDPTTTTTTTTTTSTGGSSWSPSGSGVSAN